MKNEHIMNMISQNESIKPVNVATPMTDAFFAEYRSDILIMNFARDLERKLIVLLEENIKLKTERSLWAVEQNIFIE